MLVLILVTAASLLGVFLARRLGRLPAAAAPALVLLAAAWVLAKVAYDTDYRDAEGWVDCWPSCTVLQRAVGITLVYAPLVGLCVLAALAGYGIRRFRDRAEGG